MVMFEVRTEGRCVEGQSHDKLVGMQTTGAFVSEAGTSHLQNQVSDSNV